MLASAYSERELLNAALLLPTAPRLLVELGQLVRDPFVDTQDIIELLRRDTGIASRIISAANSVFYSREEPARSIEEAVAAIGFNEVHRVVGAVASHQLADRPLKLYGIPAARMRENSLFIALVMEMLAEQCGEEPRTCYTVGLLRSVGKLVLNHLGETHGAEPLSAAGELSLSLTDWERLQWGVGNCEVGRIVLEHWQLPHETVSAVRHHYAPDGLHNPVIHLLKLATAAAADRFFGLPGEEPYLIVTAENFHRAGIDTRHYQIACEKAQRAFERLHGAIA